MYRFTLALLSLGLVSVVSVPQSNAFQLGDRERDELYRKVTSKKYLAELDAFLASGVFATGDDNLFFAVAYEARMIKQKWSGTGLQKGLEAVDRAYARAENQYRLVEKLWYTQLEQGKISPLITKKDIDAVLALKQSSLYARRAQMMDARGDKGAKRYEELGEDYAKKARELWNTAVDEDRFEQEFQRRKSVMNKKLNDLLQRQESSPEQKKEPNREDTNKRDENGLRTIYGLRLVRALQTHRLELYKFNQSLDGPQPAELFKQRDDLQKRLKDEEASFHGKKVCFTGKVKKTEVTYNVRLQDGKTVRKTEPEIRIILEPFARLKSGIVAGIYPEQAENLKDGQKIRVEGIWRQASGFDNVRIMDISITVFLQKVVIKE